MQKKDKSQLLNFIASVRKRINLHRSVYFLMLGLTGGLAAWTLINVISLVTPVYKAEWYGAFLIIPFVAAALIYAYVKRLDNKKAALIADSQGLKERLTTALENIDNDDVFSQIQRDDALASIEGFNIKEHFPFKMNYRRLIYCLLCLLLALTTALLPSPARQTAQKQHEVQLEANKTKDELQKKVDEIKDKYHLSEDQIKELEDELQKAVDELQKALTDEELQRAEERFEAKLEQKLKNDLISNGSDMSQAKNDANAIKDGSLTPDQIKQKLDEIKNLADKNNKTELSDAADKAADELEKNGELSDATKNDLSQAANNASDAANSDMAQAGINPSQQTANNQGQNNQGQNGQGQDSQNQNGQGQSGQGQDGQGQDGQGQGQNGQGQGQNGQGQGGQGQGQGQDGQGQDGQGQGGQGQGGQGQNGQGQGQDGQGQGQGQGGQGGQGWNNGNGQSGETNYTGSGEHITVPNGQTDANLSGSASANGDSELTTQGPNLSWSGVDAGLSQVIGNYSSQAYQNLNTTDIPDSMKDMVKDYFTNLENAAKNP